MASDLDRLSDQDWDAPAHKRNPSPIGGLHLTLDGYDGPIDLLLSLAREHKIDLTKIQILPLAEQYLDFIRNARFLNLEIAADYLVMAAWLGYLKSRLLLPKEDIKEGEEPAEELAERLAWRLQRLEAMQEASKKLQALPRLGCDLFPRKSPDQIREQQISQYQYSLYELLTDYGRIYGRKSRGGTLQIAATKLYSMEQALTRLRRLIGDTPDWCDLHAFLPNPEQEKDPLVRRSYIASSFVACLELARDRHIDMRQNTPFGPVLVKRKSQNTK